MPSVASMPKPRPKHKDQYEIEHAARVLMQAEEIKQDKLLMNAVKAELKKMADASRKASQNASRLSKKRA